MDEILVQMAKALRTREATIAWAKGLTQNELQRAWNTCPDGRALMRLCAPVTSVKVLVQAACECIRAGLGVERGSERKAVDTLDAWLSGKATWAKVDAAIARASPELHGGGESDITNALYAAASIPRDAGCAEEVVEEVCRALANEDVVYNPALAHLAPARKTKVAVLAQLADVVRGVIPCPQIDKLSGR